MSRTKLIIGFFVVAGIAVFVLMFSVNRDGVNAKEAFAVLEGQMEETSYEHIDVQENADGHDEPLHPTLQKRNDLMNQMDALVVSSFGTSDGAHIAIQTLTWSWMLDIDLDHLYDRFERIVDHYPNVPSIVDLIEAVPEAYKHSRSKQDWLTILDRLSTSTKIENTKFVTLKAIGNIHLLSNDLAKAKQAFERLIKSSSPDSDFVEYARGAIFEIDHLQVGMEAPTFSTKTLDGKEFNLQSLRGKTVLLNFWASW